MRVIGDQGSNPLGSRRTRTDSGYVLLHISSIQLATDMDFE